MISIFCPVYQHMNTTTVRFGIPMLYVAYAFVASTKFCVFYVVYCILEFFVCLSPPGFSQS